MIKDTIRRLFSQEEGIETVEWAIVAVFFVVAGSLFWGQVGAAIGTGLQNVIGIF